MSLMLIVAQRAPTARGASTRDEVPSRDLDVARDENLVSGGRHDRGRIVAEAYGDPIIGQSRLQHATRDPVPQSRDQAELSQRPERRSRSAQPSSVPGHSLFPAALRK